MDKKVAEILHSFNQGNSREEIAFEQGFPNVEKINRFMNKHGYYWNKSTKEYYMVVKETIKQEEEELKIKMVLSQFYLKDPDPNTIAKGLGFNTNKDMAKFMNSKGYVWSVKDKNYFPLSVIEEREKTEIKESEAKSRYEKEFLGFIERNAEEVERILNKKYDKSRIARYLMPGMNTLKSFYMSYGICQLMMDFSKKYKVPQRQILEVALIDFFRKYGQESDIDRLLRR